MTSSDLSDLNWYQHTLNIDDYKRTTIVGDAAAMTREYHEYLIINLIGLIAASVTIVALLPQMIKSIKTLNAMRFTIFSLLLLLVGLFGWICYGILNGNLILVIFALVFVFYSLLILFVQVVAPAPATKLPAAEILLV